MVGAGKILVTVVGPDKPGITAALMNVLAQDDDHQIYDIGQSVTHGTLSLSFVLLFKGNSTGQAPLLKDLLFEAKNWGLNLDFKVLEESTGPTISEKFILLSVMDGAPPARYLHTISNILAKHQINIRRIDKISGHDLSALEFKAESKFKVTLTALKAELVKINNEYKIDSALMRDNIYRKNRRLIVMDMDSTLIQNEVIDLLGQEAGVGDKMKEITEAAMRGELDFGQSLSKRVAMLKGLDAQALEKAATKISFNPGVPEFIQTVRKLGYKVAVISGGFTYFTDKIKEQLGLHYSFANTLEIQSNKLTGKLQGPLIDANQKATLLELMAQQEGIHLEQVVAIGDGANDIPMLTKAGLGIAYQAKPLVAQKAAQRVGHGPMTTVLYFLGITEDSKELIEL